MRQSFNILTTRLNYSARPASIRFRLVWRLPALNRSLAAHTCASMPPRDPADVQALLAELEHTRQRVRELVRARCGVWEKRGARARVHRGM